MLAEPEPCKVCIETAKGWVAILEAHKDLGVTDPGAHFSSCSNLGKPLPQVADARAPIVGLRDRTEGRDARIYAT